MHTLIITIVALAVLVSGFVIGLCVTAKRADKAMAEALKPKLGETFPAWMKTWEERQEAEKKGRSMLL